MSLPRRVDLLVVGGGPAGLATAIHATRRGLETLVVEGRRPPLDKACGEGLMPDGVSLLEELGVRTAGLGGRPFRGIRFVDGALTAAGDFPSGRGLGVRRLALHGALIEAAERAGVTLAFGCALRSLDEEGATCGGGGVAARWIVGADGLHSRVARDAGLERTPGPAPRRFGLRRHARVAAWTERVEVHFAPGLEAYVTPVSADEVGVALLFCPERAGRRSFEELLPRVPVLAERLRGASWTSEARGAGPLRRRARAADPARGVALVGDAAGYVDAITGEGLSVAFHEARALAACLAEGSLARYPARVRSIRRLPDATTHLMLRIKERPALRRRVIAALARDPRLFDRLLAVHGRQMTPRQIGVGRLARLSLRVAGAWR